MVKEVSVVDTLTRGLHSNVREKVPNPRDEEKGDTISVKVEVPVH